MSALQIGTDVNQLVDASCQDLPPLGDWTLELQRAGEEDLRAARVGLRRASIGKDYPDHSLPVELFRTLLWPNHRMSTTGTGLGAKTGKLRIPLTFRHFTDLLVHIRRSNLVPVLAVHSKGWNLDKPNIVKNTLNPTLAVPSESSTSFAASSPATSLAFSGEVPSRRYQNLAWDTPEDGGWKRRRLHRRQPVGDSQALDSATVGCTRI